MDDTTKKQKKPSCIIPNCGKPVVANYLCNRHDHRKRAGRTIEQIIEDERGPRHIIGSGMTYPTRITKEAIARLKASAKALGFPSGYKLASHILENWRPWPK